MSGGVRSYEIAKHLVAMGHEVNMITSDRYVGGNINWHTTVEDGINVHWLPVQYSNDFGFFQRFQKIVHRFFLKTIQLK